MTSCGDDKKEKLDSDSDINQQENPDSISDNEQNDTPVVLPDNNTKPDSETIDNPQTTDSEPDEKTTVDNEEVEDKTVTPDDTETLDQEKTDETATDEEAVTDESSEVDEDEVTDVDSTTPPFDPLGDDDGDGILNGDEGQDDIDGDGIPNYQDTDVDGNGLLDVVDGTGDADSDGTPDYKDTDDDGDYISDIDEGFEDPDGDGIPNYLDEDSDGDGITDVFEGNVDFDEDGTPNYLDEDSDDDGFTDSDEAGSSGTPVDTDSDGYADFVDLDSDGDGLTDAKEKELGSNPKSTDSDGDGFDDSTEFAYWSSVEPSNVGANMTDPNKKLPEDIFYFILPYLDPEQQAEEPLDFTTDIKFVDIVIQVDLSGSMDGEHSNLKSGINNVIIDGVTSEIPGAAFGLVTFGTEGYTPYALNQSITTNASLVQTAVNGITDVGGSVEMHVEALYQTSTGAGLSSEGIPVTNTGFRPGSLPIYIMCTDEGFQGDVPSGTHSYSETIAAMNAINAKFIAVYSGDDSSCGGGGGGIDDDFEDIAKDTGSVDASGNTFNQLISDDGSGLDSTIVDAIDQLTKNIQMDINSTVESVANAQSVDTSQFIKAVIPKHTIPANSFDSKDSTTFYKVKPGTEVFFDVIGENTFFEPPTTESLSFKATIHVMGEGSLLDSREVFIIVPGKDDTGGSEG